MLIESNEDAIQMGENEQVNVIVSELEHDEWYANIIYYLKNLSCPDHLIDHKKRALKLKAMKCCLTPDGIILRCVNKDKADQLIKEVHSGYCGGHFTACIIAHKILRVGYY
jgi:hypothetical protein